MPVQKEAIDFVLRKRGYSVVGETQKKRCFQRSGQKPVYLNLATLSGKTALVLHPQEKSIADLRRIPGVKIGDQYFHSSNMRLFPKRRHLGQSEIPHGWGVTFDSETALLALLTTIES